MIGLKPALHVPARGTRWTLRLACAFAIALSLPSPAGAATDAAAKRVTCATPCVVQTRPAIYIDFWGPGWSQDPMGERRNLTNFVRSINGSHWLETLGQYQVGWQHTAYKGSWSDADPTHRPGPNPSHGATAAEATRAAHHFGVSNDTNVQIIIALPFGGTCNPYHDWDAEVGVAFVAYPYNGDPFPNNNGRCADGEQTVSHEITEAMTDPHPFHGYTPEVADAPCAGQAHDVRMPDGQTFFVQELWSNNANRCVLTS